jgi:hypothetical protein
MSHLIVSEARLRLMFDRLNAVDDLTVVAMAQSYGYKDGEAETIAKAYRSLISTLPLLSSLDNQPVRCLGIVGASSVPTALWSYLLLADIFKIPVKVKISARDIASIYLLQDIIMRTTGTTRTAHGGDCEPSWNIAVQAGDDLLGTGFWDDCDRILVFGSDVTLDVYRQRFPEPGLVIGFGHTESILVFDADHAQTDDRWMADLLAFRHRGCLAPHLVIPVGGFQPRDLAQFILGQLSGKVEPDIERAISLRQKFQVLMVQGHPAWLSRDGMWLISYDEGLPIGSIPGQLHIVDPSMVLNAGCKIGAFSLPESLRGSSPDLDVIQAKATWECLWGNAQIPTLHWCNSGIPIVTTMTH